MDIWQFNAWCSAWELRVKDNLASLLQASYYGAYWNNAGKKGKSLKSILKALEGPKKPSTKKIDKEAIDKKFRQFEELKLYGRTKVERN